MVSNIKEVNIKICEKIRLLEEEFEESDSEESVCVENDDNETPQLECNICDFKCEREITLQKHINTKHCKEDDKIYDHMTDENDMFQMETVGNETVYACNICDQAFEGSGEVKIHIRDVHRDIINHILTKVMHENEDNDLDKGANKETIECEESEIKENDGKFTCTLCYERLDGNQESKDHFIKEHKKDMNQIITGNKCEYVFCMDIELDKCSQFCNYYKNMLNL
jgi:stress-induced morphogen